MLEEMKTNLSTHSNPGAADSPVDGTHDPAAVVSELIETVINRGNFERLDDLVAPHYEYRTVGHQLHGPEELAAYFAAMRAAFPDLQLRIDEQFASGSKVCTAFTLTGTHSGDFLGLPPTGNPVSVTGMIISTVENGQIVSEWELLDEATLLRQLGVGHGGAG